MNYHFTFSTNKALIIYISIILFSKGTFWDIIFKIYVRFQKLLLLIKSKYMKLGSEKGIIIKEGGVPLY